MTRVMKVAYLFDTIPAQLSQKLLCHVVSHFCFWSLHVACLEVFDIIIYLMSFPEKILSEFLEESPKFIPVLLLGRQFYLTLFRKHPYVLETVIKMKMLETFSIRPYLQDLLGTSAIKQT